MLSLSRSAHKIEYGCDVDHVALSATQRRSSVPVWGRVLCLQSQFGSATRFAGPFVLRSYAGTTPCWLILGVSGCGLPHVRVRKRSRSAGWPPGTIGRVYDIASDGPWQYYWWTLDGPQASAALTTIGWQGPGRHYVGSPPQRLFEQLFGQVARPGQQHLAASLGFQLLLMAGQDGEHACHAGNPVARAPIQKHGHDPDCSVSWLAQRQCSRHANRHCQAAWHHSAGEALRAWRSARLRPAGKYGQSIAAVVLRWSDPAYFSREIKSHTVMHHNMASPAHQIRDLLLSAT